MRTSSFIPELFMDKILNSWRTGKVLPHIPKGGVVCDLGCGFNANFLKRIESDISQGIGIDIKTDKKSETRKIKLIESDLNCPLPLKDDYLDAAVSTAVLEHIDDHEAHLKEIYRVLKKGGILAFTTPTDIADPVIKVLGRLGLIDEEEGEDHKKYFNKRIIKDVLGRIGFRDVKVKKFQLGFNQLALARK